MKKITLFCANFKTAKQILKSKFFLLFAFVMTFTAANSQVERNSNHIYQPNYNEALVVFNTKTTAAKGVVKKLKVGQKFAKYFKKEQTTVLLPVNGILLKLDGTESAFNELKGELFKSYDVVSVQPAFTLKGGTKAYLGNTIVVTTNISGVEINLLGRAEILETYKFGNKQFYSIQINKGVDIFSFSEELKKIKGVVTSMPDFNTVEVSKSTPNDEFYGSQWLIEKIEADHAWDISDGSGSVVAVIDGGGFDINHPDLINKIVSPYNAVDDNSELEPETNAKHGTPCVSLVGAETDNNIGVASTGNKVKVCLIKIGYNHSSTGTFTTSSTILARAANHIVNLGTVSAISNSYSSSSFSSSRKVAYDHMRLNSRNGLGAVVLAAMGNDGNNNEESYPAWYEGIIGVGSTTQFDKRANSSNYGDHIDVSAPGVSTYTADISGADGYDSGDYENSFSGTSAACPVAAAVVGLMSAKNPNLTGEELSNFLEQSCEKVGGYSYENNNSRPNGSWDNRLGYGRVNAKIAVELVDGNSNGSVNLEFSSVIIDDDTGGTSDGNNNGQSDAGEKNELNVFITNTGSAEATNIDAVLSLTTANSYITITDNDRSYSNIGAGETDDSPDFDITISSDAPSMTVEFTLTLTSDQGTFTDTFTIDIFGNSSGSANLEFSSVIIDDDTGGTSDGNNNGQSDAGEKNELNIFITNTGSAEATNIDAVLSLTTVNSYITITDNDRSYSNIGAGETDESPDFDITISSDAPSMTVEFTLTLTSDQGTFTDTFTIDVFQSTLGIKVETLKNSFKVFPNPTNNILNIQNINNIVLNKIEIYNLMGGKVLEFQNIMKPLDLSSLNLGIYFLKLTSEKKQIGIFKIIKR